MTPYQYRRKRIYQLTGVMIPTEREYTARKHRSMIDATIKLYDLYTEATRAFGNEIDSDSNDQAPENTDPTLDADRIEDHANYGGH